MSSTAYPLRFDGLPPELAEHLASVEAGGSPNAETTQPGTLESATRSTDTSRARLEHLTATHFDPIWRLLRRLGVPSAGVEDAVQEVFTVAARRIGDVQRGSEKSFLYGTALRVAKGARRRLGLERARFESTNDNEPGTSDDPEALLTERRALAILDRCLDTLEEPSRAVFVLFEFEGFTLTEIAGVLRIPRGTAASRLRRARVDFLRTARRLGAGPTASGGHHG